MFNINKTEESSQNASTHRIQMEDARGSRTHDVTFVISDLRGGGAQRVLTTLANTWTDRGLRLCVITLAGRNGEKFSLHPAITRMTLNLVKESKSMLLALFANLRRLFQLRRALFRADAPIVVSFISTTNVLTILASIGLNSRIVVSERNDPEKQPLNWPWSTLRRRLYRYADAVTANNHGALKHLQNCVPTRKLFFAPNPVNPPAIRIPEMHRGKNILTVGRLSHQKAQDILLQAYALVVATNPDWKLTIVGDGPKKRILVAQATALDLLNHIEWIGWASDIERCYENAQVFVLPSRFEGTPNVLLEAMSFGLPSIVSDASPGPLEHVVDEETGLVVSAGNVNQLASAITRLIENRELRVRLGSAAHAKIAEFDRDAVDAAWESAFNMSLSGNRQGSN